MCQVCQHTCNRLMVPACARNELSHASAAPLVDVVDDPVAVVPAHVGLVHGAVLVLALCGSTILALTLSR